ncbi:MAG: hypothetical protein U1U88_000566 [Lawsonella clevelandensis]
MEGLEAGSAITAADVKLPKTSNSSTIPNCSSSTSPSKKKLTPSPPLTKRPALSLLRQLTTRPPQKSKQLFPFTSPEAPLVHASWGFRCASPTVSSQIALPAGNVRE